MTYSRATLVILLLFVVVACSTAQQKVKITGVWQSLSQKMDGKEVLTSGKNVKYITAKHWIWIFQDKEKCLSLLARKTQKDSLTAYYETFGAGSGTYKLVGNTYTETIEYFADPNYIGLSLDFTVKIEGDRLYQSGKLPWFEGGKRVKDVQWDEVFKRIE
jgi:hypothetical protein